jgi:hypothetical protein
MFKAYRYVKVCCGICKKRHSCLRFERIERNEAIDYGTLKSMANCPVWDPESKKKEGDK